VRCLTLEATAPSAVGRQHIIADYECVIFGPMPEGVHIGMTEFSIASCIGPVWISAFLRREIGALGGPTVKTFVVAPAFLALMRLTSTAAHAQTAANWARC